MFDPWMSLLAFIHAVLLAGVVVYFCRRWKMPWRDWPFMVYIIVWADLVLAGHFASLLKALNRLDVYAIATFASMGILLALFRYVDKPPPAQPVLVMPGLSFTSISHGRARKSLKIFLVVTLAFATLVSVVIGMNVYPDNADSMIYRLPRAFWYVGNGSFLHPFDSLDKRIVFYPLDGVALYVPLVLYSLPGTTHVIPSLITWMMLVYTAYRFARSLGAERLISLAAAWLVALTPSILAQAVSTNDEILAAVSLLCSLYTGWRWMVTGRHGYFLLAATALGISAGTKLHIVFLLPIIFAALGIAAWHVWRDPSLLKKWFGAIGWRTGIFSILMTTIMFAPFMFYNYASTGRFYFVDDFAQDVFNLSASLQGAFQNLIIYFSQMMFSPIADLNSWPVANDRQHFNNLINAFFNPLIAPFINEDPKYYHLGYRFVGITIPVSVRFVEFSLWAGFVWLLWPWQALLALRQKFPLRGVFFLIAITPFVWLLLWSFSTLYMEGTATYFSFYLICASPAAVFVFSNIKSHFRDELRWVTIVIVGITNLIISTNMFMYSGFRALPDLYYAKALPYDWCHFEQSIIDEIRAASKIRIIASHEKMPYFAYMRWNPRAQYLTPYPVKELPQAEKVLQILPASGLDRYGFMPIKIPGKKTPGMTYIGAIRAIGREAIFAVGNGVERRHPEESNYIVLQVVANEVNGAAHVLLDAEKQVMGLSPEDDLEFSYEINRDGNKIYEREWKKDPSFSVKIPNYDPSSQTPAQLTIAVRSSWSHKELARVTYNLGGSGSWLPEGPEY